jgi:hypothetical protein
MSLPEMIMPVKEPEPELSMKKFPPSEVNASGVSAVRSESVNYDDSEIKPTTKIDEVLSDVKQEEEEISIVENPLDIADEGDTAENPELRVKPVIDDQDIFKDAPPPKRAKKAASKKQLEHLKKAREKALATRRAKIKERDMAKKKVQFNEVLEHTDERPKEKKESLLLHLTRAELLELQQGAIEGYDTKRKARKQKKRAAQDEVRKANLVNQSVRKAYGMSAAPAPDPDDIWADCFR